MVHLEPFLDADSWATREARYARKFEAGRRRPTNGKVPFASDLIVQIHVVLRGRRLASSSIPDDDPITTQEDSWRPEVEDIAVPLASFTRPSPESRQGAWHQRKEPDRPPARRKGCNAIFQNGLHHAQSLSCLEVPSPKTDSEFNTWRG